MCLLCVQEKPHGDHASPGNLYGLFSEELLAHHRFPSAVPPAVVAAVDQASSY